MLGYLSQLWKKIRLLGIKTHFNAILEYKSKNLTFKTCLMFKLRMLTSHPLKKIYYVNLSLYLFKFNILF